MTLSLSFKDLESITERLATGFEVLLKQVEEQQHIAGELKWRLARVAEKHQEVDDTENSSDDISDWRDEIVKQMSHTTQVPQNKNTSVMANTEILEGKDALRRYKEAVKAVRGDIKRCPIAHRAIDQEDFERDFTTQGKPSELGCPFARTAATVEGEDPIAAEFHTDMSSTRSQDAFGRCPIRFLDKHSPEEVAQYFENHKHEIPRSHEICVKRYQTNESSIREMDAKYGNLVNMIQGLGNKHKAYLPKDEKVADEPDVSSTKAVEKWAETISQMSGVAAVEESERLPRSDKPLRDIRVGESPSRPWGIPVPADKVPAHSVSVNHDALPAKLVSTPSAQVAQSEANVAQPTPPAAKDTSKSLQPTQIIFNGPVFFGYAAEQAAVFLQTLNLGDHSN